MRPNKKLVLEKKYLIFAGKKIIIGVYVDLVRKTHNLNKSEGENKCYRQKNNRIKSE